MSVQCNLKALASYVPEQTVTNEELTAIVDTSDQWIVERTGIKCRHKLDVAQQTSDLGLFAAREALCQANIDPQKLTHVIAATCTPDYLTPSIACIISGKIGAGPIMAFDLGASCTGFIYGLWLCRAILAFEPQSHILFVCSEAMTRRLNWKDRSTCVLFGDAAAACVLSSDASQSIGSVRDVICQSDGKLRDLITVGGGTACQYVAEQPVDENFFLSMQGRDTYKQAVLIMVNVCSAILNRNNLGIDDVDLFVPHQANMRIIEAVGARLEIAGDRVFTNVSEYGNTSAASIPLALTEARAQGRVKNGSRVLVTAFGSGLTWGAALLDF